MNYRNKILYIASVTVIILKTGLRSTDKINDKRCDVLFAKFRWNTINLRFLSLIPRDYLSTGPDFLYFEIVDFGQFVFSEFDFRFFTLTVF